MITLQARGANRAYKRRTDERLLPCQPDFEPSVLIAGQDTKSLGKWQVR
ncbi:MAG: hypothetical protein ACYS1A_06430 [Planctomycetota bacterium]